MRILAPLLPYITVGVGLVALRNAWVAILSYHLCMVIILFFARTKIPFTQIHARSNYKILIVVSILGGAGGLLLYLFWPLLAIPKDISIYLQNIGLTSSIWPYFLVYFILVNPWLEEYYWRGYLGSNSQNITLNDLLFSGYHIIVLAGKIDIIWLVIIFLFSHWELGSGDKPIDGIRNISLHNIPYCRGCFGHSYNLFFNYKDITNFFNLLFKGTGEMAVPRVWWGYMLS